MIQTTQWTAAQSRAAVFPPNTIRQDGSGNEDVCAWAVMELARALSRAGMPVGDAMLFVDLLWRLGPELKWQPEVGRMSKDWGYRRSTAGEHVSRWLKAGLLRRRRDGFGNRYAYELPNYQTLLDLVTKAYGGKMARSQAHAPAGARAPGLAGAYTFSGRELLREPPEGDGKAVPATPPVVKPKAKKQPGNAGELVALVAKGHKAHFGGPMPGSERMKWGGALKGLLGEYEHDQVKQAVGRWWGADRRDYGFALFIHKFKGRDAELWGRSAGGKGRYIPAPLTGEDYDAIAVNRAERRSA